MAAYQTFWFFISVLAALGSCFLLTPGAKVLPSIPSPQLPSLLTRLRQMPDYSMFRNYIIKYYLSKEIQVYDGYTIFAPNNKAIEKYIQEKGSSALDEKLVKYHIVLGEQLFKNDLHIGMHRETMLGVSYKVVFYLHSGQLYVNDAPINNTDMETNKGVIHGLTKVMEITKNKCDINQTDIRRGDCVAYCGLASIHCPYGTTPMIGRTESCIYRRYVATGRVLLEGCSQICARFTIMPGCTYMNSANWASCKMW